VCLNTKQKEKEMKATIEAYFPRGFGFAKMTSAEGIRTNVFFHVTDIVFGDPVVGAEIEFEMGEGKNGKKQAAKNVRVLPQEGGKAGTR